VPCWALVADVPMHLGLRLESCFRHSERIYHRAMLTSSRLGFRRIQVEHMKAGCFQTLTHNFNHPLEQFVAKVRVLFTFRAKAFAIHRDGADARLRARQNASGKAEPARTIPTPRPQPPSGSFPFDRASWGSFIAPPSFRLSRHDFPTPLGTSDASPAADGQPERKEA
jgi:hypothetical protein